MLPRIRNATPLLVLLCSMSPYTIGCRRPAVAPSANEAQKTDSGAPRADMVTAVEPRQLRHKRSFYRSVDVLFVIDNSGSMTTKQTIIAASFPRFIRHLDEAGIDYRVGVISSDLGVLEGARVPNCRRVEGDEGRLRRVPVGSSCPVVSDPWIERRGDQTNVDGGDVSAAFSCMARLGSAGCGFEQPLESMHRALDPVTNPGFIRADAALLVVIVSDEDDCSARDRSLFDLRDIDLGPANFRCFEHGIRCVHEGAPRDFGPREACRPREDGPLYPISRYVERLGQLKPDGNLFVALVAGPPAPVNVVPSTPKSEADLAPSCTGKTDAGKDYEAMPAIRLRAFVESLGPERSTLTSICDRDFSGGLAVAGRLVARWSTTRWCLPFDPVAPDRDSCTVLDGSAALRPCADGGASGACYTLRHRAECPVSSTEIELSNLDDAQLPRFVETVCLSRSR